MARKPTVRSGIIRSGFAANLHYDGIRRVYGSDVELAGLYSPTPENARRFAEPRGLDTFDSLEALLDTVEVVHICASPAAHEPLAVAALDRQHAAALLAQVCGAGPRDERLVRACIIRGEKVCGTKQQG